MPGRDGKELENLSGPWPQINPTPSTFVIHRRRRSEGEPFIPKGAPKNQETSFEAAAAVP